MPYGYTFILQLPLILGCRFPTEQNAIICIWLYRYPSPIASVLLAYHKGNGGRICLMMIRGDWPRKQYVMRAYYVPRSTFTTFKYVFSFNSHQLWEVVTSIPIYTTENRKTKQGWFAFHIVHHSAGNQRGRMHTQARFWNYCSLVNMLHRPHTTFSCVHVRVCMCTCAWREREASETRWNRNGTSTQSWGISTGGVTKQERDRPGPTVRQEKELVRDILWSEP